MPASPDSTPTRCRRQPVTRLAGHRNDLISRWEAMPVDPDILALEKKHLRETRRRIDRAIQDLRTIQRVGAATRGGCLRGSMNGPWQAAEPDSPGWPASAKPCMIVSPDFVTASGRSSRRLPRRCSRSAAPCKRTPRPWGALRTAETRPHGNRSGKAGVAMDCTARAGGGPQSQRISS